MSNKHRRARVSDPVRVDLPDWIFGNHPGDADGFCGWEIQHRDNAWFARTLESVRGTIPGLLAHTLLCRAKKAIHTASYAPVLRLGRFDHFTDGRDIWSHVLAADARRAEETDQGDMVTLLSGVEILITAAPTAVALSEVLSQVAEKRIGQTFGNYSMHMVEVSETLGHRYGMARVLLRGSHNRDSITEEMGDVFASATMQMRDTQMGLAAYLNPLFTSLTPAIWGFAVGRPGATIIILFGELVHGTAKDRGDALRLYAPGDRGLPQLDYPDGVIWDEYNASLRWWLQHLDVLLGEATNLEHASTDGVFDPQRALQVQFTIERLFRAAQSIAATARDTFARRAVAFEALESLVGINQSWQTDTLLSYTYAARRLEELEGALPLKTREVLLPRARAGVDALRRVQDGFFVKAMRRGDTLMLPNRDGVDSPYRLEKAAAMWLRLMRNAQHGFDRELTPTERSLLMAHNGDIPERLPDLLWLYVLDLLAFPTALQPRKRTAKRRGR